MLTKKITQLDFEEDETDSFLLRIGKKFRHFFVEETVKEFEFHKSFRQRAYWKRLATLGVLGATVLSIAAHQIYSHFDGASLARYQKAMIVVQSEPTNISSSQNTIFASSVTNPRLEIKDKYLLEKRTLEKNGFKKVGKDIFFSEGVFEGEEIIYNIGTPSNNEHVYGITVLKKKPNGKIYNTGINFFADSSGVVRVPKDIVNGKNKLRIFAGTLSKSTQEVSYRESVSLETNHNGNFFVENNSYISLVRNQAALTRGKSIEEIIDDVKQGLEQLRVDLNSSNAKDSSKLERLIRATDSNDLAAISPQTPHETIRAYISAGLNGYIKTEKILDRFDSNYVSGEYFSLLKEMYLDSSKTLKDISKYLTEKTGMKISSSTVGKYGKHLTGSDSRKKALALV